MKQTPADDLNERLRLALDFSSVGDWRWDARTDIVELSPLACAIFGLPEGSTPAWTAMQDELLHPEDAPIARDAVSAAIANRTHYKIDYRITRPHNKRPAWILASGMASYDADGQVRGMIGLVQDITERKGETLALEVLNKTGALIASELDLERAVQAVTDAGVEITGAQFGAFFYNVIADSGEQYTLYTLSGVERSAFERFPMPRNTPVFAPTFKGTGILRSDDITADLRYGTMAPYHGMPKGHLPVRSYLSVPVISRTGEVVGGLFFGHADPSVFDERDEKVMVGVAAQAAVAIDNARLYRRAQQDLEARERAQAALQVLTDELDQRVRKRTSQLEATNERLEAAIAERAKAEEALRQAQKMEAVGHLTGGIAHDFNNLLTIVIGSLDTIKRRVGEHGDPRIVRWADHGLEGARRAAALTQRLLAFARRQPLDPKPVDPNRMLQSMSELLHRTLGETIEIETVLGAGIWTIEVDTSQLENAILNLALNARDAMPDGGKLTIESTNASVDEAYSRAQSVEPGPYVCIAVSDTGCGMTPDVVERVFEPFFTTKPVGHGTGLGLSQVYGFLKQSGGNVRIYSEVGQGTTIKLYFPRHYGLIRPDVAPPSLAALRADSGDVVLVVEDDPGVREMSVSLFEELGYNVLEAGDAFAALDILTQNPQVRLLFTDVGLPKMNGRQLAEEARKQRPDLKVLFTTGYARNAIVHHGRLDPGVALLVKPFSFEDLATKVRNVLEDED